MSDEDREHVLDHVGVARVLLVSVHDEELVIVGARDSTRCPELRQAAEDAG